MDKILITGGSGLLGSNLSKAAISKFEVYAVYHSNEVTGRDITFLQADLTDNGDLERLELVQPDAIVHCAALTDVDFCEKHPAEAYRQNSLVSAHIAKMAKDVDASFIHISTDMVFDGQDGNYREEAAPNPINHYGKSKLLAEQNVQSICPSTCIIRTNIYGWNKRDKYSLAEWMLNKLSRGEELTGIRDVYFSPILVNHLAHSIFDLLEKHYEGIIHVASSESCSKLDFAYKIADAFALDNSNIRSISIEELGLNAPRPKKTTLDVSRGERVLNRRMPNISQGLKEMARLRDSGYVSALKHE